MITFKEFCKIAEQTPEKLFTDYGAKTYIPIERKLIDIALATTETVLLNKETNTEEVVAPTCIEKDESGFAKINTLSRYLYLMFIYLTEYFDVDFEEDFTIQDYDYIVSHGLQNRINRLADKASTPKIKHQAIALQEDFKRFEKMLNKELAEETSRLNEPYRRLIDFPDMIVDAVLARIEADLTPQKVQKATEELKEITSQIENTKKETI